MALKDEVNLDFYLDGGKYAYRFSSHVPRIGEQVQFKEEVYTVRYVCWSFEEEPMVAITITKD